MKTVTTKPCAQGDMLFIPVDNIPETAVPAKAVNGEFIVGHSETGHHHVIEKARAEVFEAADDEFTAWVRSLGAKVEHKRSFDTHETLYLPEGNYQIRRQREYVPEGYRRAAD